jgi:malyl-CoA/(S)-citramalyl-CoA lyase
MKLPRRFFQPLAVGAPTPYRELPIRLERMIHFVPPHVEKMRAKVPELIAQVDVVLGNLEDAIPADKKVEARRGFIAMAQANEFGATGLWTRVNALNSPWALDDVTEIVAEVGPKLDVLMLPKVEGPWDIHYIDQLLAQLEAKHGVQKPILVHAILETAEGVNNVEAVAAASPRMHGMSLGPADLAASRGMKTTRVGGGHPEYKVLSDPQGEAPRIAAQQDLWHYTIGRMVDACLANGLKAFYGPFGDFSDPAACEAQFPQRVPHGLRRSVVAAPLPDRDRQARVRTRRRRGALCQAHPRRNAGRHRGGDDRRQDAGRRNLEAGQGHRRPRPHRRRQGSGAGRRLRRAWLKPALICGRYDPISGS